MAVGFLQLLPLCSPEVLDVEPSGEDVAQVSPTSNKGDMKVPQVSKVSPIFRHFLHQSKQRGLVSLVGEQNTGKCTINSTVTPKGACMNGQEAQWSMQHPPPH